MGQITLKSIRATLSAKEVNPSRIKSLVTEDNFQTLKKGRYGEILGFVNKNIKDKNKYMSPKDDREFIEGAHVLIYATDVASFNSSLDQWVSEYQDYISKLEKARKNDEPYFVGLYEAMTKAMSDVFTHLKKNKVVSF